MGRGPSSYSGRGRPGRKLGISLRGSSTSAHSPKSPEGATKIPVACDFLQFHLFNGLFTMVTVSDGNAC